MWITFKNEKFETVKLNLGQISLVRFTLHIIYITFLNNENTTIRRSFNDNFDEIVEKLINL